MSITPEEIAEKRKQTEERLKNIGSLPAIPKVVFEVNEMLKNHNSSTVELTNVIGQDQGLATKILKIANSPLYGLQRKVTSLEFAIVVLGLGEISNLVTAIALSSTVNVKSAKNFNYEEFWQHSMMVGIGAKNIARNLGKIELSADAFIAGILHDLGVQILLKFFPDEFEKIVEEVNASDRKYLEVETEVLGLTHQDLGRFLMDKWGLPSGLSETLSHHHHPSKSENHKTLVSIVHLADAMTQILHTAPFSWDKDLKIDGSILKTLDFQTPAKLKAYIKEYKNLFSETLSTLNLVD